MLNVGVVGLGYWGPNLLRVLVDMEATRVSRICDLDAKRLAQFARPVSRGRSPPSDFDDLLEDDALDAIVIATPVFTHFELASRSLAAGKHTFVEKPLAPSSERGADAARDAAAAADVVLMCGPHVPLQPAGARGEGAARPRGARRDLLHLLEPREPRPAPARRQRRLGPRARTTSRSSCTGSERRPHRSAPSGATRSSRASPTSPSSRSSSRPGSSPTSS